jgi:viroplasmin and RNaseH domain-containing protein
MTAKGKKWYAVRTGRNPGIYTTWDACRKQIFKFPGAEYKSFPTKEAAELYMKGRKAEAETPSESIDPNRMTVYVDGSFMPHKPGVFSFGVVFLYQGKVETASKRMENREEASMRNVAGEIHGARYAMETCLARGIHEMDLYYDYLGIEKWCVGEWRTNTPGTKALKAYYDSIKDKLTVHFHKVKSHTGVTYNEMADKLAKKALLGK